MVVTSSVTESEQSLLQIERLLNSHTLHGSEALCKLLRYLADHALKHPGALKEYQIATEVFGRPTDFDPQVDSLVRVQAGRLRAKLAEYYASEGIEDSIIVELPKGTYTLSFHRAPVPPKVSSPVGETSALPTSKRSLPLSLPVLVLAGLLVVAVIAIGVWALLLTG